MTLNDYIKNVWCKEGGTVIGFAEKLGWNKQKLYRILNGQDISREDALRLYTGTNRKVTPNDIYLPH